MNDALFCRNLIASDPILQIVQLFTSKESQSKLLALYALEKTLFDISRTVNEPSVAIAKLAWWQQELVKLKDNKTTHPITNYLSQLIKNDVAVIDDIVKLPVIMSKDIEQQSFESWEQLQQLAQYLGGNMALCTHATINQNTSTTHAKLISNIGTLSYLYDKLISLVSDLNKNRMTIPLNDLAEFQVNKDQLLTSDYQLQFKKIVQLQIKRLNQSYQTINKSLDLYHHSLLPFVLRMKLEHMHLQKIDKNPSQLQQQQININWPLSIYQAWNTSRKHKKYV